MSMPYSPVGDVRQRSGFMVCFLLNIKEQARKEDFRLDKYFVIQ